MNFCTQCGTQLPADVQFCTSCGAPVPPASTAAEADSLAGPALDAPTEVLPPAAEWPPPAGVPPAGSLAESAPPSGPVWAPEPPPPRTVDSRRLTAVIAGLVVLAVLLAAAVVLLTRHNQHPPPTATTSSPSTPGPQSTTTSPEGVPTTPPPVPPTVANIADEATITAPPAAANNHDKAGNATSYGTDHLTDGDPTTAWRMVGDGSGAEVVLTFGAPRTITKLGLINGYAKTDPSSGEDRYGQERRITAVSWTFDDGTSVAQPLSAGDPGVQLLTLPQPKRTQTVRLHIDTVTGYTKPFNYTAISEIQVDGG